MPTSVREKAENSTVWRYVKGSRRERDKII